MCSPAKKPFRLRQILARKPGNRRELQRRQWKNFDNRSDKQLQPAKLREHLIPHFQKGGPQLG